MEKVGQNYGFIHYRTKISGPREGNELFIQDVHDRALIFIDGEFKTVYMRDKPPGVCIRYPQWGRSAWYSSGKYGKGELRS